MRFSESLEGAGGSIALPEVDGGAGGLVGAAEEVEAGEVGGEFAFALAGGEGSEGDGEEGRGGGRARGGGVGALREEGRQGGGGEKGGGGVEGLGATVAGGDVGHFVGGDGGQFRLVLGEGEGAEGELNAAVGPGLGVDTGSVAEGEAPGDGVPGSIQESGRGEAGIGAVPEPESGRGGRGGWLRGSAVAEEGRHEEEGAGAQEGAGHGGPEGLGKR